MKHQKKSLLSEQMRIEKLLEDVRQFVGTLQSIGLHRWIRDLRKQLHMSQKQLAHRARMTQPRLSNIESGKAKITLETIEKIFSALFCDVLILPLLRVDLKKMLHEQAHRAAQKKLASISGSMALEEQLPSSAYMQRKIAEVAEDLLRSGSTEIWEI
jgi:transcriptional regulator with XRE-family HTH domain